ncbi:MAG TPA: hydroxysqualene dehydroxylase HpnE [Pedococcus sp.]
MTPAPVVVVGGGLAGSAAALRLSEAGERVVLVEARGRLGGRACSGARHGHPVDTGAHVALRCYAAYLGFLERVGSAHLLPVRDRLDIPVIVRGRTSHLTRAWPLRYAALSPGERVRAVAAGLALRRVDPTDPASDAESFGHWLDRHGQDQRAVRRLWGLLGLPALNLEPGEASLAMAAKVFRTALFEDADAADLGVPVAPLGALHDAPVRMTLQGLGVELRTNARVLALDRVRDGLLVSLRDRNGSGAVQLRASGVVLAVPHQEAAELVPSAACPERDRWVELGSSPIVNTHLLLDRPVLHEPLAATPDSELQWLFDRTTAAGHRGQYLVSSVSAAGPLIGIPAGTLVERQVDALRRLLPAARGARVVDAFVTREPAATFRAAPGTARLRPGPTTLWPQLVLAGAWTDTGWPDTLEGAVRSGLTAASSLVRCRAADARQLAPGGRR